MTINADVITPKSSGVSNRASKTKTRGCMALDAISEAADHLNAWNN